MSSLFTATTSPEPSGNFTGLLDAICQNPLIRWFSEQNRFVLLALIVILLLLIFVFRLYISNLNYYSM